MTIVRTVISLVGCVTLIACGTPHTTSSDRQVLSTSPAPLKENLSPGPDDSRILISKQTYQSKLEGFWLGICIANWTGLVTEMDKIGDTSEFKTGSFYTREDWGTPDQPSIWAEGVPGDLSENIDFVFRDEGQPWGADDDTDIEYMYQHLLYSNGATILTPEQIRDGWLTHIKAEEENYLWVSNQRAYDLMRGGMLPPDTSAPEHNRHFEMIDAQLTTEIFGLFAPGRPDVALQMAKLPISVTARENAQWISEFYVVMYSLSAVVDPELTLKQQTQWLASKARTRLPADSYSAAMYDFVVQQYRSGATWESARDALYQRYQIEEQDGYDIPSKNYYCDGCFAAGINFAASIVSLLYGEGDIIETIKIGSLAGWDSDNPTATWGGLLGFMLGRQGVEAAFGRTFSNQFNIHRTRVNFPANGIDSFEQMAKKGITITDRVVQELTGGHVDFPGEQWIIPLQRHKVKIRAVSN